MSESVKRKDKLKHEVDEEDERLKQKKSKLNEDEDLEEIDEDDDEEIEYDEVEDEEVDDEESMDDQEVQVDFEALPPEESDAEGMQRMLRQLFLKDSINVGDLVKELIGDKDSTIVIKQVLGDNDELLESEENKAEDKDATSSKDTEMKENDEDYEEVYGLNGLIDLNSKEKIFDDIKEYLISLAKTAKCNEMQTMLENETSKYLLFNERFINLPMKLSLLSFHELNNVIKQKQLTIKNLLLMCKVMEPKIAKKKSKKSSNGNEQNRIFMNPEEEILFNMCDKHFAVDVSKHCDSDAMGGQWDDEDQQYTPYRYLLCFSNESWLKAIEELNKNIK